MKNYETEARSRWGNTDAYREHEQKTKNYTKEKWAEANDGLMAIFAEFAACNDSGESADSAEAQALAHLKPDIINPEPSELIGGSDGKVSDMSYVKDTIDAIRSIDKDIYVEQAAGITNGKQVYDFIMAGSEGAGAASGIVNSKDPIATMEEMIKATRQAADDLKKRS